MIHNDTIVALSTPVGPGALAIIRLSGPKSLEVVGQLTTKSLYDQAPQALVLHTLYDGSSLLDEAMVACFRAPRSFTQEDLVEITCHGSPYIIGRLLDLLLEKGARLAGPGEFTQRAFLHGRLDLSQAEGVGALIAAESQGAHKAAVALLRGGLTKQLGKLRKELIGLVALLELELDFAEEEVTLASPERLDELISALLAKIAPLIEGFAWGNLVRAGVPTVLTGPPNVGKSTLLNALLGEEKALVSALPGTTRDVIEDKVVVEGICFRFIDTAGLRESGDPVEQMGIARAKERLQHAGVILSIVDLTLATPALLRQAVKEAEEAPVPQLVIGNKIDQAPRELLQEAQALGLLLLCAKEGEGLPALRQALVQTVTQGKSLPDQHLLINARHRDGLYRSEKALQATRQGLLEGLSSEWLVVELREALQALGEITGEIHNEDILSHIFSSFCIGK